MQRGDSALLLHVKFLIQSCSTLAMTSTLHSLSLLCCYCCHCVQRAGVAWNTEGKKTENQQLWAVCIWHFKCFTADACATAGRLAQWHNVESMKRPLLVHCLCMFFFPFSQRNQANILIKSSQDSLCFRPPLRSYSHHRITKMTQTQVQPS